MLRKSNRRIIMKRLIAVAAVLAAALTVSTSQEVEAAEVSQNCTYEIQVEYWFFDTDYSYWKTMYSTTDQDDAQLMYDLLLIAKQNHQLNSVVPNEYWRYVAVDVRLVKKCRLSLSANNSLLRAKPRLPASAVRTNLKLAP